MLQDDDGAKTTLTRTDLVQFIAARDKQSLTSTDSMVRKVLSGIVELLQETAIKNVPVSMNLPHFGSFKIKASAERIGRNPRTGESLKIPSKTKLLFQPGKEFKDAIKEAGNASD